MKIHLDLDCFFCSAERTRYPFLKGKNVVIVKGSDKTIFSNNKKSGVMVGGAGAFNSAFEFRTHYYADHITNAWKKEFIDEDGTIHGIVITKSYEAKNMVLKQEHPLEMPLGCALI